jgi:hypothetical protein
VDGVNGDDVTTISTTDEEDWNAPARREHADTKVVDLAQVVVEAPSYGVTHGTRTVSPLLSKPSLSALAFLLVHTRSLRTSAFEILLLPGQGSIASSPRKASRRQWTAGREAARTAPLPCYDADAAL